MGEAGVPGKVLTQIRRQLRLPWCETAALKIAVMAQFDNSQEVVIPKRGMFARGFCCSAAGSKQVPRR